MDPLQSEEKTTRYSSLEDEDVSTASNSCRCCCRRRRASMDGNRTRRLSSKYISEPNTRNRHPSAENNNSLTQPLFATGGENFLRSRSESNRRVYSATPKSASKESRRKRCCAKFWKRNFAYLTIVNWLPAYSFKNSFLKDLVSGITVGVMAVPQAMSYATVAGLPPIYGLYNAFIGMLPYPFFGTSPHLISGPTAVMSILVNGIIPAHPMEDMSVVTNNQVCTDTGPGTGPDSLGCHVRIQMALTLSFLAGVIQILFGLFGLGFLTNLISEPIIIGFTTGSAFLIAGTQITHVFGIAKCKTGQPCDLGLHVVDTVVNIFANITKTSWQTLLYGVACLLVLYLFKYQIRRLVAKTRCAMVGNLGPLVVMLSSILIMAYTGGREALDPSTHTSHLNHTANHTSHQHAGKPRNDWGIRLVGSVCALDPNSTSVAHPQCLPAPHWSMTTSPVPISLLDLKALIGPAIAVVMIGYMESMSIAKTVARQETPSSGRETRINPSYELTALGFCNLACSFFRGYPVTGSFSRTAVNANSGAQSPFAALCASLVVGSSLLFLTPALQYTPKVALAAIVLIAIVKLIKVKEAIFFLRVSVRDFAGFLLVFGATIFLGVEVALVIGIASSWILFLVHNNQAHAMVLGKVLAKESAWCSSSNALFSVEHGGAEALFVDMVSQALDAHDETGLAPHDVRTTDHIVILRLYGDLSFSSAENFRSLIDELCRAVRPHSFVIDCTNVNDVDSSGVHALEVISSDLKSKEVIFGLAALPKHSRSTLTKAARYNRRLKSGPKRWQTEVIGNTEYVPEAYDEEGLPALLIFKQVATAMRWCASASVVRDEPVEEEEGDRRRSVALGKRTMTGKQMGSISKSLEQTLGNKVQLIEAPQY